MAPRRLLPLLAVLLLALAPLGGSHAAADDGGATAAAKKRAPMCKVGNNKKKCRCPKGYARKRNDKGYRCKKKSQPQNQDAIEGGGTLPPTDGGSTNGGSTDGGSTTGGSTDGGSTTGGSTTGGSTTGGSNTGGSTPTQPAFDPAAKFADIVSRMSLLRNYQVPKPSGGGYNNHSESYGFCNDTTYGQRARHYYEGIAYIYDTNGPWRVISGQASQDGATGSGTIEYTQQNANFNEEIGKVQTIQISWQGDVATVAHPEIGTNNFAKSVSSTSGCTRTS